jgi:uncharacterized phage protein (TIGR01671 family)
MQREIQFRAWDIQEQRMIQNYAHKGINGRLYIVSQDDDAERTELMQFTGLLDKNGKKIFEGDIVRFRRYYEKSDELDQGIGVVEFCKRDCLYYLQLTQCKQIKPKPSGFFRGLGDLGLCEVIGNIYENPELLEG